MTFEEWNVVLARFFFNPGRAGKRVYLHTTKALLVDLSRHVNGVEDFVAAIKQGPATAPRGNMCAKALTIFANWRAASPEFPPYIAFLCFFALAAGHDGDWPRHAYYPRLWDLLGEPNSRAPHKFRPMSRLLWRDLEVWTHSDKKGGLGLFKWQTALEWEFVGLPVMQTILTDEERAVLPILFEEADLEPGALLPEGQLAAVLAPIAHRRLRKRTVQLLCSSESSDYRSALFELLQAELQDWDGSVQIPGASEEHLNRRGGLRLWLKEIDPVGCITSRVVAFLPESVEPDDILLESSNWPQKSFECPALGGRVTDALRESGNNIELVADALPWENRSEFRCIHTGLRLILPACRLRIFASGGSSLTGFIEAKKIPPRGDFFVAVHASVAREIDEWGTRSCRNWKEFRAFKGLPANWRIFSAADVLDGSGLAARYPALTQSSSPRIRFEGGVRGGNGAAYFPFALPEVVVDWNEKPTSVRCNGELLRSDDGFRYPLDPNSIQAVNPIDAEIGQLHVPATLFVVSDGWRWNEGAECPAVDQWGGEVVSIGNSFSIRGAQINALGIPEFVPDAETVAEEADCAVLLGRVPGQIVDLRRGESLPYWPAVWAVSIRRRQVAFVYCGTSIDVCQPVAGKSEGNSKKWASVIWVNRKKTEIIRHPRVRELLSMYREVARDI